MVKIKKEPLSNKCFAKATVWLEIGSVTVADYSTRFRGCSPRYQKLSSDWTKGSQDREPCQKVSECALPQKTLVSRNQI